MRRVSLGLFRRKRVEPRETPQVDHFRNPRESQSSCEQKYMLSVHGQHPVEAKETTRDQLQDLFKRRRQADVSNESYATVEVYQHIREIVSTGNAVQHNRTKIHRYFRGK